MNRAERLRKKIEKRQQRMTLNKHPKKKKAFLKKEAARKRGQQKELRRQAAGATLWRTKLKQVQAALSAEQKLNNELKENNAFVRLYNEASSRGERTAVREARFHVADAPAPCKPCSGGLHATEAVHESSFTPRARCAHRGRKVKGEAGRHIGLEAWHQCRAQAGKEQARHRS